MSATDSVTAIYPAVIPFRSLTGRNCAACGELTFPSGADEQVPETFIVILGGATLAGLCTTCVRQLEEACYVAIRERSIIAEGVTP